MPARKIVAIRIATRMGRIKWPGRVESIRGLKNDRTAIREKKPQKFDWTGLHQFVFETLPVYSLVGSAVVVRKDDFICRSSIHPQNQNGGTWRVCAQKIATPCQYRSL